MFIFAQNTSFHMKSDLNIAQCISVLAEKTTKSWAFWRTGIAMTQSTPVKFIAWRRCVYFNPMKRNFTINLQEATDGTDVVLSATKTDFPSLFIKAWIFIFAVPAIILTVKISFDIAMMDLAENDARYLFLIAFPVAVAIGLLIISKFNQISRNDMEAIKKFLNENLGGK